jgi:16S rRNA (uracil1498-N3)-methyltransferase
VRNDDDSRRCSGLPRIYLPDAPDAAGGFTGDRNLRKRLTRVLRLRPGDRVEVVAAGTKWECALEAVKSDSIRLRALRTIAPAPIPGLVLTLGQAIPKGERFEWLIEKATEIGITAIYPLLTERTVVRPSNLPSRLQRWNEIAGQAAGQSEAGCPVIVHTPLHLPDFLALPEPGLRLFLHEREGSAPPSRILEGFSGNRITFIVGPEGGWSAAETEQVLNAGFTKIHLGDRIMRSETCALVLASILHFTLGDFR